MNNKIVAITLLTIVTTNGIFRKIKQKNLIFYINRCIIYNYKFIRVRVKCYV